MRNDQQVNAAMSYQQSSPHDKSLPHDELMDSADLSVDSFPVFSTEDFLTSTPAKATFNPAEFESYQHAETVSHSESTMPSSKASTDPFDSEDTNYMAMNTKIIEQLQFHPSRVWDRK